MNDHAKSNVFVFIGILLYNFLFWQEKLGINALFFSLFIMGSLLYLYPDRWKSREVILTGLGTLTTAIFIVLVNSDFVKIVHMLSLITFAGFVQQKELRFVFYAFSMMLINLFRSPRTLLHKIWNSNYWGSNMERKRWTYNFNVFVIPMLVIGLFYMIYYGANPKFAALSDGFWNHFYWFVEWDISWDRVLFLLMGLLITGGLLWKNTLHFFVKRQEEKVYTLQRNRQEKETFKMGRSPIGLKNEYRSGWLLFMALNSLLFIVNLTDIIYVWFSPAPQNATALMNYVHEGTYLLILAILLAMLIILILFRKNLNFFPFNGQLQKLAYFWLAQNAVLVFSVGMRNYRYIEFAGLAYKRIGVILFLLLTLYGLFSLYQKISEKRSFHFVLHQNAWALYFLLFFAALINWYVCITRYNLSADTPKGIDANFLIDELSDKNLYLLLEAKALLADKGQVKNINGKLARKQNEFLKKQASYSWLSWNWADYRNLNRIQQ